MITTYDGMRKRNSAVRSAIKYSMACFEGTIPSWQVVDFHTSLGSPMITEPFITTPPMLLVLINHIGNRVIKLFDGGAEARDRQLSIVAALPPSSRDLRLAFPSTSDT